MTRNLLSNPAWQGEDLGAPLPDDEHAISVCIPTWKDVIGYEEGDPKVLERFSTGYPRFCCHRYMIDLFTFAEQQHAVEGETALVFSSTQAAARCSEYLSAQGKSSRVVSLLSGDENKMGPAALCFARECYDLAREYWRYCGEIISSRQAQAILANKGGTDSELTVSDTGSLAVKNELAKYYGVAAESVFLFPTGMAAVSAVQRMLVERSPQSKTIQCDFPYVDVLKVQDILGSGVHLLEMKEPQSYQELAGLLQSESIAGVYAELASNPLLSFIDVPLLRELTLKKQTPLILDDTIASAANIDTAPWADLITVSLTKLFSGMGNVMGGAVIVPEQSQFQMEYREWFANNHDSVLAEIDAAVLAENSLSFKQRTLASGQSAAEIAEVLSAHPAVEKLYYPQSTDCRNYDLLKRKDGTYGNLLSFYLKGGESAAEKFYDAAKISKGPSLGTEFSLLCPYVLLAHYEELQWAEEYGARRDLLRLSVGLEGTAELLGRLSDALAAI